ncbi:MAG: hypothetical protein NDJ94_21930 [Vicinamibacteria bacterium]|nr:hypothetical protein [Vicinamibacteria bacterium]
MRRVPAAMLAGRGPRWLAIGFGLLFVALRWEPVTGLTGLMRFGERHAERRLPELRALPLLPSPGDGYDGQFYAQVAVRPVPTDPDLVHALDKPSYRPRRILLPVLAHLLGGGDPWRVLHAFALLHTAAWLAFAALMARVLPEGDPRRGAAWLACVLAVGALDSLRMTLTDLPAALALAAAAVAAERGRGRAATALAALAGAVREVSLLGLPLLRAAAPPGQQGWHLTARRAALCALPIVLWCGWLDRQLPGGFIGPEGNVDWPGVAFLRAMAFDASRLLAGDIDPQWTFGLAGGLGLAAQSLFLLRRAGAALRDPWLGLGVPFALFFWIVGADPWLDYRALARHCLPMTIAFNVLLARAPGARPLWFVTNVSALDGVLRMTYL